VKSPQEHEIDALRFILAIAKVHLDDLDKIEKPRTNYGAYAAYGRVLLLLERLEQEQATRWENNHER